MPKAPRKRFIPERDPIETRSFTKKRDELKKKPSIQKRKSSLTRSTSNLSKKLSIDFSAKKVETKNDDGIKEKQKRFYNRIAVDDEFKQSIPNNIYNKDKYGNLKGNCFDLALDKAFQGKNIAVLQFYRFDFNTAKSALEEKGFTVHLWDCSGWMQKLPDLNEFIKVLKNSCQLWIISTSQNKITDQYLDVIEQFFNSGRGLYLWGDNQPLYEDANIISKRLFNNTMKGDVYGDQTVKIQEKEKQSGLVQTHLICTGLEYLYEGITIATIDESPELEPVCYGSANNLVIASYSKYGKRAIIDGGFTRLFYKWDTAGTGRYVKNAASWLANIENFDF